MKGKPLKWNLNARINVINYHNLPLIRYNLKERRKFTSMVSAAKAMALNSLVCFCTFPSCMFLTNYNFLLFFLKQEIRTQVFLVNEPATTNEIPTVYHSWLKFPHLNFSKQELKLSQLPYISIYYIHSVSLKENSKANEFIFVNFTFITSFMKYIMLREEMLRRRNLNY